MPNPDSGNRSPMPPHLDGQDGGQLRDKVSQPVRDAVMGGGRSRSRGYTTAANIQAERAARGIPQIEVHRKPGRLKKVGQWALTALTVFGVGAEVADQALNQGRVTSGAIQALEQPLSSHASSGGHVSGQETGTVTPETQMMVDGFPVPQALQNKLTHDMANPPTLSEYPAGSRESIGTGGGANETFTKGVLEGGMAVKDAKGNITVYWALLYPSKDHKSAYTVWAKTRPADQGKFSAAMAAFPDEAAKANYNCDNGCNSSRWVEVDPLTILDNLDKTPNTTGVVLTGQTYNGRQLVEIDNPSITAGNVVVTEAVNEDASGNPIRGNLALNQLAQTLDSGGSLTQVQELAKNTNLPIFALENGKLTPLLSNGATPSYPELASLTSLSNSPVLSGVGNNPLPQFKNPFI